MQKTRGGGTLSTPDEVFGDLSRVKFKHFGFTLAEMMVVMLILSIIMAAMAPVMTTRNKLDQSSPWSWSTNGSDAYYGLGDAQVAMIGQEEVKPDDDASKLIINAGNDKNHILFKTGETVQGFLRFKDNTIALSNSDNPMGENGVAIGSNARSAGNNGIAIGYNSQSSKDDAIAVGKNAGAGKNSVSIGSEVLSSESGNTDMNNVAIGYQAMHSNTNAQNNTAIGYQALYDITSGSNNIAIGSNALRDYNSGYQNIAIGSSAILGGASGSGNVAIGDNALNYNGGGHNVAIGYYALGSPGASFVAYNDPDVSIGIGMLASVDGSHSIAIGSADSTATTSQSISGATAVGDHTIALGSNVYSYDRSIAIGYNTTAGYDESEKSYSGNAIAIGTRANAIDYGIAIGDSADASTLNAEYGGGDVAIGREAWASKNGAIAIGYDANSLGKSSVAIGQLSRAGGDSAVAIGEGAEGYGENNIAIGKNACVNTRGPNKICIGANSGPQQSSHPWARVLDKEERIFIGSKSKYNNGTAVLEVHNTTETAPNGMSSYSNMNASGVVINGALIVRGPIFTASRLNSSPVWNALTNTELRVLEHYEAKNSAGDSEAVLKRGYAWENLHPLVSSDRRLKYVGKENTSGLEKIKQLKVFNYTFKKDDKKTPHVGVIAQDLQKVFPDAVTKAKDGFLRIRFEDMFFAMINAIKELDSRITALEKENQKLKEQNKELDARLKVLEAKVK